MNQLGFTESWLKDHFNKVEFEAFEKHMYGQTVSIIDNETTYYYFDVQNFCSQYDIRYPSYLK